MKILSITNAQIKTFNTFKKCKQCKTDFFCEFGHGYDKDFCSKYCWNKFKKLRYSNNENKRKK